MDDQLREYLAAFRSQVRACRNVARTTLQMAAELEERIDLYLDAQPEEAQRNGNHPGITPFSRR